MIVVIFVLIVFVFVIGFMFPILSGVLSFDPKKSKTFHNKQKIGYKLNVEPEESMRLMTAVKKNITAQDMSDPNVFEYDIEELIQEDLMRDEKENEILSNLKKRQLKSK